MATKGFGIEVYSAALGNGVTLHLADWMLSKGDYLPDYAPAFDQYSNELLACQRYTEIINGGHIVVGRDASAVNIAMQFAVPKRTLPTVICNTASGFSVYNATGTNTTNGNSVVYIIARSINWVQFYMAGYSGLTANLSYFPNPGGDGAFFIISAEL